MTIMKTFKLDKEPKIKTGFTVPENYFEDFSAKMMQNLPKNEPKIISIFARKKTWIYAAASVIALVLSLPIYNKYFSNSSEFDEATLENYITYQSNVSDSDLMNLLDEQDIKKIAEPMELEDDIIEKELTDSNNLEQYLIN